MNEFLHKFNLNPKECILRPCEYGFNIPFEDSDKLPLNCMSESRKLFSHHPKRPEAISGIKQNEFQIKIYSKSFQFPLVSKSNILRVEEKNNRSRGWQNLGINTINDLLIKENHFLIYKRFKDRLKQVIMFDEYIKRNSKNRAVLDQFSNPNYWRRLIQKGSNNKEYNKKKKTLEKLSRNQGTNILEKILFLIDLQYYINYNLTKEKPLKIENIRTYAHYKKSTYAQLCKECDSSIFFKWNTNYISLRKVG